MAKEMMIVFVYDTLMCMNEADDPAEAVLYFHPGWVSDSQRLALCGQLMGVTHCLKALFSTPKILTLHSGKFIIVEYGRFILAIGSDRNIPDWMLKNRASILTSLIKVYHCDLQTIAMQFPNENTRFSEKLYQMFETYLPILQYGGYMFKSVPLLNLPKSASNVYLEGMQILDFCRKTKGVLGGSILFNNKILATQLHPKTTSRLAMVDPFRVKSPAEAVVITYDLPAATQLLVIYLRKNHFENLKKKSNHIRSWNENAMEKVKTSKSIKPAMKEMGIGMMKRDKSLLFTAVPEEEIGTNSPSPSSPGPSRSNIITTVAEVLEPKPTVMPDVVPFSNKPRIRPNKLSLSFKNSISKDSIDEHVTESKFEPVFTGQTSICSTPMLEFKQLHGNVMSICRASTEKILNDSLNATYVSTSEAAQSLNKTDEADKVEEETAEIRTKKNSKTDFVTNEHYIPLPINRFKKFNSLSDINSGFKRISQMAAMRFGKNAARDVSKVMSLNSDDSPIDEKHFYKTSITISDPHYPVFRNDGVPISKSLFDEYLYQQYSNKPPEKQKDVLKKMTELEMSTHSKHFEGFDSDMLMSPRKESIDEQSKIEIEQLEKPDPERRKSLTLPLKSLGGEKSNPDPQIQSASAFESHRKKMSGVQLTPLMEKLSHLAFSEKSSGYSSRGITPMEFKDFAMSTPCIEKNVTFPEPSPKKTIPVITDSDSETDDETDNTSYSIECKKCSLFVSGLQNTSMLLILEEDAAQDPKIINHLWETTTKNLTPLEQMCMEPIPSGDESTESYSFLSLDSDWGPVKKGGPWASNDIATMGFIHKDFADNPSLTEVIIRSEDSLVFGTMCGGSEVYYQESGSKQPGLPTSADLMGTAPLKSKRRLQRDHSITIF